MNASKTDIRITSPDREVLSYSGVPKEHPFVKESPELFWYAVRVTYSRELALKEYLDGECIENFIPMHYEYIVKNERRVRKLVPAVHNLVFIRSSRERIDRIKDEMGMTLPIRYIMDRESRQPIVVPTSQMRSFMAVAGSYDQQLVYLEPSAVAFHKGQRVRVKTRRGESDAIVMHDSAKVDENALAMMVTACHAGLPLAPVIGVYSFIPVGRGVKNV